MTLAEALRPLHAEYLRRLAEMVARLPEGAALVERIAALDEGGLPARIDVSDARDGHAYEVHGAHPDAPLSDRAAVGELEVRLGPGNWEELPVACVFAAEASPADGAGLAGLLRGFAMLAAWGGFAAEGSRSTGHLHGVRIDPTWPGEVRAVFDLGTCGPEAVEALCRALAGFSRDGARLAFVRIGG